MQTNPKHKKAYPLRTPEEQYENLVKLYPNRDPETLALVVLSRIGEARKPFRDHTPEEYKDADFSMSGYFGDEVENFVRSLFVPGGERFLLFTGPVGCGKTHAAYAAMNIVLNDDPERMVMFENYASFVQKLRSEFSNDAYSDYGSTWDRVLNQDNHWPGLVILDDIGANKISDFETEKLYTILDRRIANHEPTIITTNIPSDSRDSAFGPRVSSRLERFKTVEFPNYDFRKDNI